MEAIKGSRIVYLYRILDEATSKAATNMAFVTENSRTFSKDADITKTKDGSIRTPSQAEISISTTSVLAKDDTLIAALEAASKANKLLEIWEVNLDQPASAESNNTKFKGTYYQGYLTSFEKSSPADGFVECTLDFGINGDGADGNVTVTTAQQEAAVYAFADTTKATS